MLAEKGAAQHEQCEKATCCDTQLRLLERNKRKMAYHILGKKYTNYAEHCTDAHDQQ